MNYLAHIVLSGKNNDVLFGNFIGDGVKGNSYISYKTDVKKGILLHRYIDNFTDNHPLYLKSKRRFYGKINKLSGVVTDILYDYLLWENWSNHYSTPPSVFISESYSILDKREHEMPNKIRMMYYYMRKQDWLNWYSRFAGIEKAILALSSRVGIPIDIKEFHLVFQENSQQFHQEFNEFYKDIKYGVNEFFKQY